MAMLKISQNEWAPSLIPTYVGDMQLTSNTAASHLGAFLFVPSLCIWNVERTPSVPLHTNNMVAVYGGTTQYGDRKHLMGDMEDSSRREGRVPETLSLIFPNWI